MSEELKYYLVQLVRETRNVAGVQLGASPRASLTLLKTAQALALFDGLEYILPEHIQELAVPVIAHRLKLDSQARFFLDNTPKALSKKSFNVSPFLSNLK